jgi:adenine-specific DNA-methyltransferase
LRGVLVPKKSVLRTVDVLKHDEAKRKNIPTAEYQALVREGASPALKIAYEHRNRDLDPQLVWRGKDLQDLSTLTVNAPPLYIQEKVHPKALIDDLLRQTRESRHESGDTPADLFADFNGVPKDVDKTEFYQHDLNWSNRMILGDSLQVMASLVEREGLRGKVQCIYFDPPYGITFNSNFQWSTTSRDVKDNAANITREPEQVKAFRDTWRDGIHSYLGYLRDRLTVSRDLLAESGSLFVQISDENLHLVTALLDEVFGPENKVAIIPFRKKTMPFGTNFIEQMSDFIVWFARNKKDSGGRASAKYRKLFRGMEYGPDSGFPILRRFDGTIGSARTSDWQSSGYLAGSKSMEPSGPQASGMFEPIYQNRRFSHPKNGYACSPEGLARLDRAGRILPAGNLLRYLLFANDKAVGDLTAPWGDTVGADGKTYVVQTNSEVIKRCVLMATDPGDLVLDPTCGSGTTATVAEQWGRRWITIDTSRVALALARARIMGARYTYYLLADSRAGQQKEAEVTRTAPSTQPVHGNIRHGFVYERVPHVTLKSIANNAEIDVIWDKWQQTLEPLREKLNKALKKSWQEWEIPREAESAWAEATKKLHADWWQGRIARQNEIDASIAAKAEFENLYDKPYEDRKTVRVAGPFTVESLSPHRVLDVDENDELIDSIMERKTGYAAAGRDFPTIILENLKAAGVQQSDKSGKIDFTALTPWPGELVCAEGRYMEGSKERRAAIFIGPEFGTVTRPDLVAAARAAAEAGFDVLVACAFNFEAHTTEFGKLGKVPVLKARMNADLLLADEMRKRDKANLFVIFGEPDIEIVPGKGGRIHVKVKGVDVFDPSTGEVRSDDVDGIACWFIDTDYNEESFFVRHAYFLGANDPYKALKTTLKAEIDQEAWESLHSDTSRPFDKPKSGRIAVKVINHLGDEVMKVFRV